MDGFFRKSKITLSVLLIIACGYVYGVHREVERSAELTQAQQATPDIPAVTISPYAPATILSGIGTGPDAFHRATVNAKLAQNRHDLDACIEENDSDGNNPVGRRACRDLYYPKIGKLEEEISQWK